VPTHRTAMVASEIVVDFIELSFLAVNDERLQQKVDGRELIVGEKS